MSNRVEANRKLYKSLIDKGYKEINSVLYTPVQVQQLIDKGLYIPQKDKSRSQRLKRVKTGWIDDTLNLKNKDIITPFVTYVKMQTGLTVWPEFVFLTDRLYRFDYTIPVAPDGSILKIAIEQQGGIHARGNSGHSSGTGIQRDMDKASLAAVNGWILIQRVPSDMCSQATIELIRSACLHRGYTI